MKLKNKISTLLRIISYRTIIFLLVLITGSCKKYLDKKSNTSLVVPTTLNDAQGLLDDALYNNERITPSFGEASADDYFLPQTTYDAASTSTQNIYKFAVTDYSNPNGTDWLFNYRPVYSYNTCLNLLQNIPLTSQNEAAWKNVKGSALFYRAYNFLNLCWNHAKSYDAATASTDLGIVLRRSTNINELSVRSTVEECYSMIIRDVKEAAPDLPDIPLHVYRPSKAAAYGLLARTYLSMRNYDSALIYSNLCLQIKNQLMNYNIQGGDVIDVNANLPFKRFNIETIFYSEMNNFGGPSINTGRARIDTLLYSHYDANDLREIAFFLPVNGYQQFKGTYTQSSSTFFSGITTDEMYLTRAECYARGGTGRPPNPVAALADLDTLLVKRWKTGTFIPLTIANTSNPLTTILLERRKELLMRGLRWMDIKRLNKDSANIIPTRSINGQPITLQPNANYYALPIPKDIIDLTGMPQNPG